MVQDSSCRNGQPGEEDMPNTTFSARAALALAGLAAIGMAGTALADPAAPRPPERIYAHVCGYCHGARVGPILRGRHLDPAYIAAMARTGPRAMPAFRQTEISDGELHALAEWISRAPADPKEVGQ